MFHSLLSIKFAITASLLLATLCGCYQYDKARFTNYVINLKSFDDRAPRVSIHENIKTAPSAQENHFNGSLIVANYPKDLELIPFLNAWDSAIHKNFDELGIRCSQKFLVRFFTIHTWPANLSLKGSLEGMNSADNITCIGCPILPLDSKVTSGTVVVKNARFPEHWIFVLTHEFAEVSLLFSKPPILGDYHGNITFGLGRIAVNKKNRTRWFREACANHVAYTVCRELGVKTHSRADEAALAELGDFILRWDNLDETPKQKKYYYPAADALLDRILRTNPPGALARIMKELERFDYVDGKRLDMAIRKITGHPVKYYIHLPAQ